jgi:hypothetical protein
VRQNVGRPVERLERAVLIAQGRIDDRLSIRMLVLVSLDQAFDLRAPAQPYVRRRSGVCGDERPGAGIHGDVRVGEQYAVPASGTESA